MTARQYPAVALLLVGYVSACSRPIEPPPAPVRPERVLWLPDNPDTHDTSDGAVDVRNGRSLFVDGSACVSFSTTGSRESLSTRIVQHFAEVGWIQRETQLLNPQFQTSFRTGWRHQCACVIPSSQYGRRVPMEPYSDWEGEWNDREGDIVVYHLSATGAKLRGFAQYIPAGNVAEIHRMLGLR